MSTIMTISEMIKNIVMCIVDDPDAVNIEETSGDRSTVINIRIAKPDVGKIIGREGKTIMAIRTISENIATKNKKRVTVNVID